MKREAPYGPSNLFDGQPGVTQEFDAGVVSIDFVVVHVANAASTNQQGAVDAGAVRNEDACAVRGVTVVGEFGDGVEFGVLHFGAGDEFAVDFVFTTVVVASGHPVPTERNDRIVLDDDATDLKTLGVAALGGQKSDLHVHFMVFFDIHRVTLRQKIVRRSIEESDYRFCSGVATFTALYSMQKRRDRRR